jgi:glycosyltransferase involved in cell wall biosynthesis
MLRRANRIIAISQATACDLARFYGIPADRIAVIYPACASSFAPVDEAEIQRVRGKYGLPEDLVLNVGRIDPKNNLSTLVWAFAAFRKSSRYPGKLALVGGEYPKSRDTAFGTIVEQLGLSDSVLMTGRVPVEDLPGLYGSATMVVFPSLHEGFGIVAAEAMACGAPLVVSDAGALGEAVGDAALVIASPRDVDALAAAMARLWREPGLRRELRRRGLDRVRRYRPQVIARQTLALYRDVVEESGRHG